MAKKLEIKTPAMGFINPEAIKEVEENTEIRKDEKKQASGKRGRPRVKNKKKQYTLTLTPDLYEEAFERAEELGISFSALTSMAIQEYLKK